jgi:hypothetical protein
MLHHPLPVRVAPVSGSVSYPPSLLQLRIKFGGQGHPRNRSHSSGPQVDRQDLSVRLNPIFHGGQPGFQPLIVCISLQFLYHGGCRFDQGSLKIGSQLPLTIWQLVGLLTCTWSGLGAVGTDPSNSLCNRRVTANSEEAPWDQIL